MSKNLNPISFKNELGRKATHLGALIMPVGYYFLELSREEMLTIMVPITVVMIILDIGRLRQWAVWHRGVGYVFDSVIRDHEIKGDFTGATYILISTCLTVALYEKHIAIAALSFIIVGDTFAAIIGRKFGRHKFKDKSFEGSLACLCGTLIVAFLVPGLHIYTTVLGAVVATVVEALSFNIDDNVSVPILSGLAMTLFFKIFHSIY